MRRFILTVVTITVFAVAGFARSADYLDVQELKIGSAYVASRQTPIMPEIEPADPMAALGKMKQIPVGGAFKIYAIQMKNGKPWYKVRAIGPDKEQIGSGYINSTALLGQSLILYGKQASRTASEKTSSKPAAPGQPNKPRQPDRVTITSLDGTVYERCKITRVEPDGITVMYAKGVAKIPFPELPAEYRNKYGYNPKQETPSPSRSYRSSRPSKRDILARYHRQGKFRGYSDPDQLGRDMRALANMGSQDAAAVARELGY